MGQFNVNNETWIPFGHLNMASIFLRCFGQNALNCSNNNNVWFWFLLYFFQVS